MSYHSFFLFKSNVTWIISETFPFVGTLLEYGVSLSFKNKLSFFFCLFFFFFSHVPLCTWGQRRLFCPPLVGVLVQNNISVFRLIVALRRSQISHTQTPSQYSVQFKMIAARSRSLRPTRSESLCSFHPSLGSFPIFAFKTFPGLVWVMMAFPLSAPRSSGLLTVWCPWFYVFNVSSSSTLQIFFFFRRKPLVSLCAATSLDSGLSWTIPPRESS